MSDNSYDFGEILDEALKGKTGSEGSTATRLNGTFKMVAKYASADRKTKAGHPQISIVWQVVGGPQADEETWHNVVFSPKSKAIAGRTLLALGVSPEYLKSIAGPENFTQGLVDIADALVGVEVELKIKPQASNTAFDDFEIFELISGPHLEGATVATFQSPGNVGVQAQTSTPSLGNVSYGGAQQQPVVGGFVPQV